MGFNAARRMIAGQRSFLQYSEPKRALEPFWLEVQEVWKHDKRFASNYSLRPSALPSLNAIPAPA
jgi:hypothetical protein